VARNNATHPIRILVVDDEAALCAILREAFEAEGFVVSEARDKATLFRSLETESVNLITLDWKRLSSFVPIVLAHRTRLREAK
jgi:DNA-binding response OmpR family regulator